MVSAFSNRLGSVAVGVLCALFGLAAWPNVGRADTETLYIDVPNSTLGSGTGGALGHGQYYVKVDVTRTDSTHATVVFTSGTFNGFTFRFVDAAVNVNGSFSSSPSAFPRVEGGFGVFNAGVSNLTGFPSSTTSRTLSLTATKGNRWATVADVLTPTRGHEAAANIFMATSSNGRNVAMNTGFAADGPLLTPELSSGILMSLMAGGFVGFAGIRRFRGLTTGPG